MHNPMLIEVLIALLASIEENGGSNLPKLKLICDKKSFDAITTTCAGLINKVSEIRAEGLNYIIELGDAS